MVVWQWDIQPTLTWFGLCPEKSGYPPKNSLIIMMFRFVFLNDNVVYHSSIAHVWTIMDKPLRRVSIWKFWISEIEHGFLENHHLYISGWWFGTCFILPYIENFIIPTDYIIFFRGVGQPPGMFFSNHVSSSPKAITMYFPAIFWWSDGICKWRREKKKHGIALCCGSNMTQSSRLTGEQKGQVFLYMKRKTWS